MITYTTDLDEPAWKGYVYAGLLFVAAELQSVVLHQHWDVVFTLGMRVRSSIIATVYTKVCTYECISTEAQNNFYSSMAIALHL